MAGGAVPPPPRQLEVRRFASARAGELRSLHAAVSARLEGRFSLPRSARRRTTGHLPSKRRRPPGREPPGEEDEGEGRRAAEPRRVRRRRELAGNPAEGFSVAGDGARRLRTHLWHAKRFSMVRRWGYILPLGVHGRGRGSRAVLKWVKNGVVVHDASYFIPVQLDGPEGSILSILRMVLRPSPPEKLPGSEHLSNQVFRGVCYENAMLWNIGNPPHIVGPVTYMWRPFLREDSDSGPGGGLSNAETNSVEGSCSSLPRQLWIWIHPASLKEGLDALISACKKQMQDHGGVVNCCSLEGQIARLDVMGGKAMQTLKRALRPVNVVGSTSDMSTSQHPPLDSSIGSHLWKASFLDNAELVQSRAILSLLVCDPRDVKVLGTDSSRVAASLNHEDKLQEEVSVPNSFTDGAPAEKENILPSMWSNSGRHDVFLSDCKELWDSSHKIGPPIPEDMLCTEKHSRRIKFFCLDSGDQQAQATEQDCFSRSCPIILLKHSKEEVLPAWWSIILPLSWVKPFWLFLVAHGARAIGLRERRWIASKLKLPSFPYDYPDCKAYSSFMADEAAAFNKAYERRPPAMRPPRVPIPSPWHCIKSSFIKGGSILRGLGAAGMEQSAMVFPECSPVNSEAGGTEPSPTNVAASYQLVIPRTIQLLRQYVREFDEKYLSSSSDIGADIGQPSLVSGGVFNMVHSVDEACLVRVLVRAFKEGSFEDGAVICAPLPSDLLAWKTRSEEEEEACVEKWELQLPQSHLSSYFTWLDPSNSNLQLPKDDTIWEAFRWPIGFVTTGFVHGSSGRDAVATAFCEAKLLAMLRRHQWTQEGTRKQVICVLVRNMRSAVYRRALATVVVEQQTEDLEFL